MIDLRKAIKQIGILDVLKDTATPIRLNQYFTKDQDLEKNAKRLLDIFKTLALYCVPSNEHDKAIKKILKRAESRKGHLGVVLGDFGSGKTAFMAYLWDELEKEGFIALPPLGHTNPEDIVGATEKWIRYRLKKEIHPKIDKIIDRLSEVSFKKTTTPIEDTENLRKLATYSGEILIELSDLCKTQGYKGLIVPLDELEFLTSTSKDSVSSENLRRNIELYREFVRTISSQIHESPLIFMISVNASDWNRLVSFKSYSGFTTSFRNEYNMNAQRESQNPEELLSSNKIWEKWRQNIANNEGVNLAKIPNPFHKTIFSLIDSVCFDRAGEGQQPRMRGVIRILQELLFRYSDDEKIEVLKPQYITGVLKDINIEGIQQDGIRNVEEEVYNIFKDEAFQKIALDIIKICIPLFWNGIDVNEIQDLFDDKQLFKESIGNLERMGFIIKDTQNKIRISREYMDKTVNRLTSDLSIRQLLKIIRQKGYHEYAYPLLGLQDGLRRSIKNLDLSINEFSLQENGDITIFNISGEIEDPGQGFYWIERDFNIIFSDIGSTKNINEIILGSSKIVNKDLNIIFSFQDFDESESYLDEENKILNIKIGANEELKLVDTNVYLREAAAIFYYMSVNKIRRDREQVQGELVRNVFRTINSEDIFQMDKKINALLELLLSLYNLFYPEYQPIMTKSKNPSSIIYNFKEFISKLPLEYRDFDSKIPKDEFDDILSNLFTRKSQKTILENKWQQLNIIHKQTDSTGVFVVMKGLKIENLINQYINEEIIIVDNVIKKLKNLGYRSLEIDLGIEALVVDRNIFSIEKRNVEINGEIKRKRILKKKKLEIQFIYNLVNKIDLIISNILNGEKTTINRNLDKNISKYKVVRKSFDDTSSLMGDRTIEGMKKNRFLIKKFREFVLITSELIEKFEKVIKDSKESSGLFFKIKNFQKISVLPPEATYPDYAKILSEIYKELQKKTRAISGNDKLLDDLNRLSNFILSFKAFLKRLSNLKELPDEKVEKDFEDIVKEFIGQENKLENESIKTLTTIFSEILNEAETLIQKWSNLDRFIDDYYLFVELLNGKSSRSSYSDLQFSNLIIEDTSNLINDMSEEIESLELKLEQTNKKIVTALAALKKSLENLEERPELTVLFRIESKSRNVNELKDLLGLIEIKKILDKITEDFNKKYLTWKNSLQNLISLLNKYTIDLPNISILRDSEKFSEEFPKLSALNKEFISILLQSKRIRNQIEKYSERIIEILLENLVRLKNEVLSNYETFKKIINVEKLREQDQETIQKSLRAIENIEEDRSEILNKKSKLENPSNKINRLYIRIQKQSEFVKTLWQMYQSRLDHDEELLKLKKELFEIKKEVRGPFSLHQYILSFKNLDSLNTKEIHDKLLNSAKKIFQLALAGHLDIKIDVVESKEKF